MAKPAGEGYYEHLDYPLQWTEKYSDDQKKLVCDIIDWLNAHTKTRTWICQTAGVNRSTGYSVLTGAYVGNPGRFIKQILDTIRHIDARASVSDAPFIASSVSRLVFAACQRARQYRSFAIISAEVGTGKTRALREYTADNANTVMIEADPLMSPQSLMEDLCTALSLNINARNTTREVRLKRIIDHLREINFLLVLDEAETVKPTTLEYIRRIRDKAEIGVVLAGTPRLHALVSPKGGQFDQIRSRTCYWPKPIRGVIREDMEAVTLAAFSDIDDVDAATMSALWHHCRGSMRVLVEDLIPAIRDYGLKKHPLCADLVHAVAKDVLSLD